MKKKRTIEKKIMVPFLVLVLLTSIVMGTASYWSGFQAYKSMKFNEAEKQVINAINFLGILERELSAGYLSEDHARKLAENYLNEIDSILIIDSTQVLDTNDQSAWWRELVNNKNGFHKNHQNIGLVEEWAIIHNADRWGWTLVIPFTLSYLAEPLVGIQKNTLLVMIIASIIAVQVTILLSYHLSRPIKDLALFCQQPELGKVEEETEISLSRNDEIGVLARSIQIMINHMEEKKRIEKKLTRFERLASMGQMASGLAHEIRNPLAGIKTTIQVLGLRLKLANENKELFHAVTEEINRVDRIITNLLNLSRSREPQIRQVSVSSSINQMLLLLENENKNKHLEFCNFISEDLIYLVDSDHFKQIIINISLNAIKSMTQGGKIVFYSNKEGELFIKDEGVGISKEEIDRIFDPFYTTSHEGNGLGLSIVHQLVLQNHGEIDVISQIGGGTTFILSFPVYRKEDFE